jgi:cytidylate kinase
MIITIDGPAASGKSSVAQQIAAQLSLYYLCSGMLYRACAYILHHYAKYSSDEAMSHPRREDIVTYCNRYRIRYVYSLHGVQIFFDDHDITKHLKSAVVDHYASLLSAHAPLRTEVLILQTAIAEGHDLVADGRDMGSVAFPHADYKFFLTASDTERAHRWQKDQTAGGNVVSLEQALEAVRERDQRDTIRPYAPLVVPNGATTIDSTGFTLEETVEFIMGHIETF